MAVNVVTDRKLCTVAGCLKLRLSYEQTCFEHRTFEDEPVEAVREERDVAKTELKCKCGRTFAYEAAYTKHQAKCDSLKVPPLEVIVPRRAANRPSSPIRAVGKYVDVIARLQDERAKIETAIAALEALAEQ